jgi:hypothetical protein
MTIDKRIILYQDNQMSDLERSAFESELNKSTDLSKQLATYKSALRSLNIDEQSFVAKDYFVNLVPNFRNNLSAAKKSFKFKTAYALTTVTLLLITVVLFFNPFTKIDINSLDKLLTTLNEKETAELMDYYSEDLSAISATQLNETSDSLLTELITSELNLQETDVNLFISNNQVSIEGVFSEIQSDEADRIYNEIINKKYF